MPTTGPDLVGAGYPISRPLLSLLGGATNATQSNLPVRTNLDWGFGNFIDGTAAGGGGVLASAGGQMTTVAVPALPGDVITKVSYIVGATTLACANITNEWAALYSGSGSAPGTAGAQPTLIGQTASPTTLSQTAKTLLTFTFAAPQLITTLNAPFGFVYVGYSFTNTAGTGPSFLCMQTPSAALGQPFTNGPVLVAGSGQTTLGSTAPATMSNLTTQTQVPIVFLQ